MAQTLEVDTPFVPPHFGYETKEASANRRTFRHKNGKSIWMERMAGHETFLYTFYNGDRNPDGPCYEGFIHSRAEAEYLLRRYGMLD